MAIDAALFSRRRPGDTTRCSLNATPQRSATASPPTDGDTTDFYGPINLAKALTLRGAWTPYPRDITLRIWGLSCARKIRGFCRNERETKINYIAIAPAQFAGGIFTGRHVQFLPAINCCGSVHADCGCIHCAPCSRQYFLSSFAGAKSSSLHCAQ